MLSNLTKKWLGQHMLNLFSRLFWVKLPDRLQVYLSELFSKVFRLKFTALFIIPYCLIFSLDTDYTNQFEPESGDSRYSSFNDFFKRRYKIFPKVQSDLIWPCEGFICDWGAFSEKNNSIVKGQKIDLNQIFQSNPEKTRDHFFVNVFLHNHNYHRVHSPVDGEVKSIVRIPGGLVFLRPWFYDRKDVSYPAFKNERVVIEVLDKKNKSWWIALVGGFGVGSIDVTNGIQVGTSIQMGQEIGKFNLGSTVCIASPCPISIEKYLQTITVGGKIIAKQV
jgi:phosphatidylserine decarboxylase